MEFGPAGINTKSYWENIIQLAKHNRVQLIWVPGHEGIVGI
jgi:ribonuclease HI